MKYLSLMTAILAGLTAAAPIVVAPPANGVRGFLEKRQSALTDVDILQFALTLENLETAFYAAGLSMFNQQAFQAAGFSQQNFTTFQAVGAEEATHVQFLAKAISGAGGTPVAPCNYTFPASDVKSFLAVSSILEGVGVSAYLGAAAAVQDKTILTAAASIMTVEARHNAFVRSVIQQAPNPNAFDNPLSPMEVFTLASTFITSCPSSNAQLPFTAFPSLALGSNSTVNPGSMITVTTPGYTLVPAPGNQLFGAFITVAGPMFAPATATANGFSLQVPQGLSGQSYMVMTSSNTNVTDATTAAGPLLVEITP